MLPRVWHIPWHHRCLSALNIVCRLVEDTAWHPVQKEVMDKWSPVERFLYKTFLGSPLKLWASIGHWWIWHFDLNK